MSAGPVELALRVAELERIVAGIMRHGTVHSVDPAAGTMRLRMGDADDGTPFLSPSVPYVQTAGAMKFHNPPSVGQQMTLLAPAGDWQQAVAVPMTWSAEQPSPDSAGDRHVMTFGSVTVTIEGDELSLQVGDSLLRMTPTEIYVKSAKIETDGPTHLDGGDRRVHYKGGVDSDGDVAIDAADRVYV